MDHKLNCIRIELRFEDGTRSEMAMLRGGENPDLPHVLPLVNALEKCAPELPQMWDTIEEAMEIGMTTIWGKHLYRQRKLEREAENQSSDIMKASDIKLDSLVGIDIKIPKFLPLISDTTQIKDSRCDGCEDWPCEEFHCLKPRQDHDPRCLDCKEHACMWGPVEFHGVCPLSHSEYETVDRWGVPVHCPVCGKHSIATCCVEPDGCPAHDRLCYHGHKWSRCPKHGTIIVWGRKEPLTSITEDTCICALDISQNPFEEESNGKAD